MDARLDKASRQRRQGIAGVDRDRSVHRLLFSRRQSPSYPAWAWEGTTHDPLPVPLAVQDLKTADWLAEEQGDGPQVGVAGRVHVAHELVILL